MSQNFVAVAQQFWDPLYELQLQNMEVLDNTTHVYPGVLGDVYNRRLGSFGELAPIGFNASNIPVSAINYSQTPIPLFAFAYKTVVSEREMVIVGSEGAGSQVLQEQSKEHAIALGRYMDYLKLQAIFSDTSRFVTVAKTVGYGTGMNSTKIIQGVSDLQNAGITDPAIFGVIPALLNPSLAADEKYSSWFYNDKRILTRPSGIPRPGWEYYGAEFRVMSGVGINSLPYTATAGKTYNVPLWSKDVITLAMSALMPKTTIWYNPGELRYEITTQIVMGAGVTQVNGVVLLNCDTNNTLNT